VVGVTHESYAYDSLGHLITADDGVTRLEFSYDSLGRLTSEKQNGKMVTSNYDALGNIIETMNPDGASIYRKYDTLGRPTRISRQVSSTGSLDTIANYNYVGLSLASREY
jgi:YD repeat-containing protein